MSEFEFVEVDLSTALRRFGLALTALVRCAADHLELDWRTISHVEIIPSPCGDNQVIVTVGGYDVFVARNTAGELLPGFVWTHEDVPYAKIELDAR